MRGYGIGIDRRFWRTRVRFSGLAAGIGAPLPGGWSYTQAAGAGQTEETVVTSWSAGTIARGAFVANTPKIGRAPSGVAGLRLQSTFTNYVQRSDAFDSWTPTGTSVVTANTTVSPDGTQNADTLTDDDGAGYELVTATVGAIPTDTARYRLRAYVANTVGQTHAAAINWSLTGGTPIARSERYNSNDGSATGSGLATMPAFGPNWRAWEGSIDGNGTNTGASLGLYPAATTLPLPGVDTTAGLGVKVVWGVSITRGKLSYEYQPTGAAVATVANAALTCTAAQVVSAGRVRLRIVWSPAGAPTDYTSNFRIFDHGAETTYAEVSAADQKLRIVVAGGAAEVLAVPLWWPAASLFTTAHPLVEFALEFGGNIATKVRYRYSADGGVTWSLPFDPAGGTAGVAQGNVSSSGSVGIMTGAAAGNVADGWLHDAQVRVAPAWAAQWLPTDDASVKAWLRADGHYALSAGLVSAWTSQTATAISAAQGTAANQPTFAAAGLNGGPGLTFDGTNDGMIVTGLSAGSTDMLGVFSLKPNIVDAGSRALFDTQTGRLIMFQQESSGTVQMYDGAAFRDFGAASTTAAQILAFDLRATTNARAFRNGVQLGSTQNITQRAIGGTVGLGARYDGTLGSHATIGDFILSTTPSDTLRRQIEAFLSAKTGISVS